ncbi:MAG: mechanosensitive ion channel family protein [Synechocystis sp.]|nr:mechanosensitive ion channel family protein [Synechocystis sp.]
MAAFSVMVTRLRRYFFLVCLSAVLVALTGGVTIPTWAQLPSPSQLPSLINLPLSTPTPTQSFAARQSRDSGSVGNLDYTTVRLDGQPLFLIAVLESGTSGQKQDDSLRPIEYRKQLIESRLQEIIQRGFDPQTLAVTSSILNGLTVIQVNDQDTLGKYVLLTITSADAQLYAQSVQEVADATAYQIKTALIKAQAERQPAALKQQIILALCIAAIVTALSLILLIIYRWLGHRSSILKLTLHCIAKAQGLQTDSTKQAIDVHIFDEVHQRVLSASWLLRICDHFILIIVYWFFACKRLIFGNKNNTDNNPLNQKFITSFNSQAMVAEILAHFEDLHDLKSFVRQRFNQLVSVRRLLFFFAFLVWVRGVAFILQVFPATRWQGQQLSGTPLSLLLIWFSVLILVKISDSLIAIFFQAWAEDSHAFDTVKYSRNNLRLNTISGAVRGVNLVVFIFSGFVLSLSLFNIPVTTILAGAGILGFAISFGSQSIIKDLIAGISNLVNDSFAVDDFVQIGEFSGTVENLNLFVTRIRCSNGDLVTIPNGTISTVCNQTKDWSRVDFSIMVAADTNLKKAIAILQQVALGLYHDPGWHLKMLEVPDFKGVEDISHQGILLKIWLKTLPGEQWAVARELRLRVKVAFEVENIAIGIPQQKWLMETPPVPAVGNYAVNPEVTD